MKGLITSVTKSHFGLLNTKFLGGNAEAQNLPGSAVDFNNLRKDKRKVLTKQRNAPKELGTAEARVVQLRKTPG